MRALIEARYPDHGILGEEFGSTRLDADWVWVLDPVDGTRDFATGTMTWGSLIGLCFRSQPVLGVIDQPVAGERWIGAHGHPCAQRPSATVPLPTAATRLSLPLPLSLPRLCTRRLSVRLRLNG